MSPIETKFFELFLLHLGESTVFALVAVALISALRPRKAKSRYLFLQLAMLKFLVPVGAFVALTLSSASTASNGLNELITLTVSKSSDYVASQTSGGWWLFLLGGWIGGILCMGISHTIGLLRVRKLIADSAVPNSDLAKRIENILSRTGVASASRLSVLISKTFTSIGVAGFFRPRLIINATFLEALSDEELLAAFKHELAHIERRDNFWRVLHSLSVAIFWFHPLVWFVRHGLRQESELACDEVALMQGESPESYATCLLKAASYQVQYKSAWVTAFTAKSLKNRVRKIVNFKNGKESKMKIWAMHLIAICVVGFFAAASTQLYALEETSQPEVYDLKDLDTHPKPVHQVKPEYPENLKENGISGWVKLEWIIDSNGNVLRPRAVESSLRAFEQPAVEAILKSKWQPGTIKGKAVSVRVRQRMDFKP